MAADDVEHAGDLGTVVELAVGDVFLVVDAEVASRWRWWKEVILLSEVDESGHDSAPYSNTVRTAFL